MKETTFKCDVCRKTAPSGETVEVRVDSKMHDLCKSCSDKLEKVLRGTGRPVQQDQGIQGVVGILGGNYIPNGMEGYFKTSEAIPYQPVIVPSYPSGMPTFFEPNSIVTVTNGDPPNPGMNVSGLMTSGFMTNSNMTAELSKQLSDSQVVTLSKSLFGGKDW